MMTPLRGICRVLLVNSPGFCDARLCSSFSVCRVTVCRTCDSGTSHCGVRVSSTQLTAAAIASHERYVIVATCRPSPRHAVRAGRATPWTGRWAAFQSRRGPGLGHSSLQWPGEHTESSLTQVFRANVTFPRIHGAGALSEYAANAV